MGRIANNKRLRLIVRDSWSKMWKNKILLQAEKEKSGNSRLRGAMKSLLPSQPDVHCEWLLL